MRRADMIPLALLGVLAGVVGFAAVRQPIVARTPTALGPGPGEVRPITPDAAESPTLTIVEGPSTTRTVNLVEREVFTANPKSDEIVRRMQYGAAGTYILEMLQDDSAIVRWPVRATEPIRVWVDPSPALSDWDPRNAAAARDGFQRWTAAGIPVRMNFLRDSGDAEVRVRWSDKMDGKTIGVTRRVANRSYWLNAAEITIALHEPGGATLSVEAIRAIATHEAGHMLGLEHSPFDDDIMASGYSRQIEPSGRDLKTMELFYTISPGRFR